jgi:C1A family cysteine protease
MITPNTKKGMGWWPGLPDFRDYKMPVNTTVPFKNTDYRPLMPPLYDQGQTSACIAHGIAAAIQYRRRVNKLPDFEPSRLFIYANARIIENDLDQDDGAEIRDGIKSVVAQGAPDEKYWPFDTKKLLVKPSDEAYKMGLTDLVSEYQSVDVNEASFLTALEAGYPVVFGITLYDSFDSDAVAATGIVPMPSKTEKVVGGHCMLIVGAEINERQFIVRNSWGSDWGGPMEGYCMIPFDYMLNQDLVDDCWIIKVVK